MLFIRPTALVIAACFCAVLPACTPWLPAAAPPQLSHTPGAYIEIAPGHFQARDFQFNYPSSWRLIKESAAKADAMHIILRAPKGGELSMRVVESQTSEDGRFIPLAKGKFLLISVDASIDSSPDLFAEIEQIVRSIRS